VRDEESRAGADRCGEDRDVLGELRGQVPANFLDGGLGQPQTHEADFTKNQDRVAGAGA
jgi:hypothetical protein